MNYEFSLTLVNLKIMSLERVSVQKQGVCNSHLGLYTNLDPQKYCIRTALANRSAVRLLLWFYLLVATHNLLKRRCFWVVVLFLSRVAQQRMMFIYDINTGSCWLEGYLLVQLYAFKLNRARVTCI